MAKQAKSMAQVVAIALAQEARGALIATGERATLAAIRDMAAMMLADFSGNLDEAVATLRTADLECEVTITAK
jgi:hypothetical protein